jgi:predicted O-methyltransferase YrrM
MAKVIRLDMTRNDLALLIDAFHIQEGVEIGVAYGEFSHNLLRLSNLKRLLSIDAWLGKYERCQKDAASKLEEFGFRSEITKASSQEAAAHLKQHEPTRRFGFIYIDADHRGRSVQADIQAWMPLLDRSKGSIFAGHDYLECRFCGVVPIVNQLADKLGLPIHLTKEEWPSWFFLMDKE